MEDKKINSKNINAPKKVVNTNTQTPLQKKSVWFIVFLSIITFGIYNAFWYLNRKKEFENLNTEKKLNKSLIIIFLIISIISALFTSIKINDSEINPLAKIIQNITIQISSINIPILVIIIGLLSTIIILVLAFRTRTILNETLQKKKGTRKVSGFFTFIFNLFYLQYEINRIIENKENEKRTGPWIVFLIGMLIGGLIGATLAILPYFINFY
jgi:hypothetical protein